jgi:hypothetical protein
MRSRSVAPDLRQRDLSDRGGMSAGLDLRRQHRSIITIAAMLANAA